MSEEDGFLNVLQADRNDLTTRLVYADWLDERSGSRGQFLRRQLELDPLSTDHPLRPGLEEELSRMRVGIDRNWLRIIEPERGHLYSTPPTEPRCSCVDKKNGRGKWSVPQLHAEPQDTECDPWKRLLDMVEDCWAKGTTEFAPFREMSLEDRVQIVTLPLGIAKLKKVEHLYLYHSSLVRIPPEIGEMASLRVFTPYTSYRLHWYPYEITRCSQLTDSTVSTRSLYGNYKYRPPFPELGQSSTTSAQQGTATRMCSVCNCPFPDRQLFRVWISLRVATDVLPLLVNACSQECVNRLPKPAEGHTAKPHRGGGNYR